MSGYKHGSWINDRHLQQKLEHGENCRNSYALMQKVCECPSVKSCGKNVTEATEKGIRDLRCPLVEVQKPHGRLIDADALIHELEYDIELEARYLDYFDGTHTERITSEVNKKIFETAIEILQKAPTIIEAEGE